MKISFSTLSACAASLFAALLTVACSDDEWQGGAPVNSDVIVVDATIKSASGSQVFRPQTRYSGSLSESAAAFTKGDEIGIYVWAQETAINGSSDVSDPYISNRIHTLGSDGSWSSATPMLYKNNEARHTFLAFYPARVVSNISSDRFEMDMQDMMANDLLVAWNNEPNDLALRQSDEFTGKVALPFRHLMGKLKVEIVGSRPSFDEDPNKNNITMTAKLLTACTINYLSGAESQNKDAVCFSPSLTVDESQWHRNLTLQPVTTGTTTASTAWYGIVIPQTIDYIELKTGENNNVRSYTFASTTERPITVESGKLTTVKLTVGNDFIELADVTVSDWEEGETIDDVKTGTDMDYTYNPNFKEYRVYTAEGLMAWHDAAIADPGVSITLENDIVLPEALLNESNWEMIPYFNGYFDGNEHTISGLTMMATKDEPNTALIKELGENGLICNLRLKDVKIRHNEEGIGYISQSGLVHVNNGCVYACLVEGDFDAYPQRTAAGLVNTNKSTGKIIGCYNNLQMKDGISSTSDTNATGISAAGICLYNYGTIACCIDLATNFIIPGSTRAPDFAAIVYDIRESGKVDHCYWTTSSLRGVHSKDDTATTTDVTQLGTVSELNDKKTEMTQCLLDNGFNTWNLCIKDKLSGDTSDYPFYFFYSIYS